MRRLLTAFALSATVFSGAAQAQTVVELYTSQGCSSCPPADEILAELAQRDDIVALALHVDYWDYLGWKDDLAQPAFTQRQRDYAEAFRDPTIYTPQMIIGGVDHVVGSHTMKVVKQLMAHGAKPNPVRVALSRSGDTLTITAQAVAVVRGEAVVQIVRYTPLVTREIRRGENAGRTVRYVNAVTSWQSAGRWNTAQPLSIQAQVAGTEGIAVIVQDGTDGPILGAAQLR